MATATKTGAGAILTAVYNALNVAAITTTLGCGVYETMAPQAAGFPYVLITTPSGVPFDTFGIAGKERIAQVHVFASSAVYESGSSLNSIADKVVELLNHQALSVTGHTLIKVQFDQDNDAAAEDVNGVPIMHRVVSFRVHLQETA